MSYETLIYEQEDHVVPLTRDRPHQHDVISREVSRESKPTPIPSKGLVTCLKTCPQS